MWHHIAAMALLLTTLGIAASAGTGAAIEGRWLTEKSGVVEIYPCGDDTLCGRLLWLRIKPSDRNPQALDNRKPKACTA
jgi:hypothetical protein